MEPMTETIRPQTGVMRYVWIGLGCASFVLGTIGIFLPILPTVPFYLLTLACFAKGSARLHAWFRGSRFYKDHLEDFLQTRSLTVRSKLTILLSLSFMMGIGFYFMHSVWARGILLVVWAVHLVYIGFVVRTKRA